VVGRVIPALEPISQARLLWYLGNSLMATSHVGEAVELLERSVARERFPGPLGFLAITYARAGRQQDAERVVAELTSRAHKSYVPPRRSWLRIRAWGMSSAPSLHSSGRMKSVRTSSAA
jgi:hypothetical protein